MHSHFRVFTLLLFIGLIVPFGAMAQYAGFEDPGPAVSGG